MCCAAIAPVPLERLTDRTHYGCLMNAREMRCGVPRGGQSDPAIAPGLRRVRGILKRETDRVALTYSRD